MGSRSGNPVKILISYPFWDRKVHGRSAPAILDDHGDKIEWVLDSGAFSAFKSNMEVELDPYCKFLTSLPHPPKHYFALDVVGDPDATWVNYQKMLDKGLSPVPIFTRGDSLDNLERYYEHSDIVGLGGLVKQKGSAGFVRSCMDVIGDRKVHWLGFNQQSMLAYYKPHMVDSSSWMYGFRYGRMFVYKGRGKFFNLMRKDFIEPKKDLLDMIRRHRIDPRDLGKEDHWRQLGKGVSAMEVLLCRSWVEYQRDVKKVLGVNYYLAVGANWPDVDVMVEARDLWLEGILR